MVLLELRLQQRQEPRVHARGRLEDCFGRSGGRGGGKVCQRGSSGGRAGEASGARVPRRHTLVQRAVSVPTPSRVGQRDEHVGVVEQLARALGNVGATRDDELEQSKLLRPSKSPRRKEVDLTDIISVSRKELKGTALTLCGGVA